MTIEVRRRFGEWTGNVRSSRPSSPTLTMHQIETKSTPSRHFHSERERLGNYIVLSMAMGRTRWKHERLSHFTSWWFIDTIVLSAKSIKRSAYMHTWRRISFTTWLQGLSHYSSSTFAQKSNFMSRN